MPRPSHNSGRTEQKNRGEEIKSNKVDVMSKFAHCDGANLV
jgi:hypothetical protein